MIFFITETSNSFSIRSTQLYHPIKNKCSIYYWTIRALWVHLISIFDCCLAFSLRQNNEIFFADLQFFLWIFKIIWKSKKTLKTFFKTFPGVIWGPTKNVGVISSTVLIFIGYKNTHTQTKTIPFNHFFFIRG